MQNRQNNTILILHFIHAYVFCSSQSNENATQNGLALADGWGGRDWQKRNCVCPIFPFPLMSPFSVYVVTVTGFNGSLVFSGTLRLPALEANSGKQVSEWKALPHGASSSLAWFTRILCSGDITSRTCEWGVRNSEREYCMNAQPMLHVPSDFIHKTQIQKENY